MAAQVEKSKLKVIKAEVLLQDEKWVKRTEDAFAVYDADKDGLILITDIVKDMRKYAHLTTDQKLLENFRKVNCEYAETLGLAPGISLTKEEYIRNLAAHVECEVECYNSGKGSMNDKMNAFYDLLTKSDDGTISLEEFRNGIKVSNFDVSYADMVFKALDKDQKGRLTRKELIDYHFNLWYTTNEVAGREEIESSFPPKKA